MIWNTTFTNRLMKLASDPKTHYTEVELASKLSKELEIEVTRNAVHHKLHRTLNQPLTLIETDGIKYIGSKRKIIPYIVEEIRKHNAESVLDLFAGTTRVGQALKKEGFIVGSNDLASYSYAFGKTYLEFNDITKIDELNKKIRHLNNVLPVDGFLTQHYAGGAYSLGKQNPIMFFQRKNTMKADAIRDEIDNIAVTESLEWYILITSLILALDKVDNTVGVQQAFLKHSWAKRAENDLTLQLPKLICGKEGKVYREDANVLVDSVNYDLTYIDPPYTSHNYATYYHIHDSVVRWDNPTVKGMVNSPTMVGKSKYNSKATVQDSFEDLIRKIGSRIVLISYNDEGLIPYNDLVEILSKHGKLSIRRIEYKRNIMHKIGNVQKKGKIGKDKNTELLFTLIKGE